MITVNKPYSRANLAIEMEHLFQKHRTKFTDLGKFLFFREPMVIARLNFSLPRDNKLCIMVDSSGRAVGYIYFSNPREKDQIIANEKLFYFNDIRAFASLVDTTIGNIKALRSKDYVEELY